MQKMIRKKDISRRSALIDCLRGCVVISMVLYHAMWDLVNLYDIEAAWFCGIGGFIWQQITCCSFILLSGFCSAFGKHTLRRGIMVFGLGMAVSVITMLFMPEEVILFGVLTLIGSCMIFVSVMKKLLIRIPSWTGVVLSLILFAFTRGVNDGAVGVFFVQLFPLPDWLYHNYLTAYLGFPPEAFWSTDYFSFIPWVFLFLIGFFLFPIYGKRILSVRWKGNPVLNWVGRQALMFYILHQPVIYGLILLGKYIFEK